jgi:hypothetical protein
VFSLSICCVRSVLITIIKALVSSQVSSSDPRTLSHSFVIVMFVTIILTTSLLTTLPIASSSNQSAFATAEPSITITEKDCSKYPESIHFRYLVEGLPSTVSNYLIVTYTTIDGTETVIARNWVEGIERDGTVEGAIWKPPVGLGPYTITYYEATSSEEPNVVSTANIVPLPDGIQVSTIFTCEPEDEATILPVISVPDDIIEEATNLQGAEVLFEVSAYDQVDGPIDVDCNYDSGETFPIGETVVTCSAENLSGNRAEKSFTITVQDTTTNPG